VAAPVGGAQDRFATLGPLVSVLFLAAILTAFWYLRNEEIEREEESVRRDTEVAQQSVRLRLIENQEHLVRMAREIATAPTDAPPSWRRPQPRRRAARDHELSGSTPSAAVAGYSATSFAPGGDRRSAGIAARSRDSGGAQRRLQRGARDAADGLFAAVHRRLRRAVFQAHVPLSDHGAFAGTLIAEYSIERLVRHFVPAEISNRHAIAVLDDQDRTLASTVVTVSGVTPKRPSLLHEVPLAPAGNGLALRGQGHRTSIGLISNTLFWMVVALSVLTVWMLLGTWRHMRRRLQMQDALVSETNFRRAMENSMLTGMRAMDLDGQITYVNAAFCAMTGFDDTDLIGQRPPFPHWPSDRIEENSRLLQQELQGKSPPGGIEVKVKRKDGSLFDARMYVSPLVDARGDQTGWVTSMTNITEAKRIRDQLTASHERFTTVLEGLDAAVSVLSVQRLELLFANRSYRLWFGADSKGHALLAGDDGGLPFLTTGDDAVDDFGGLPTQELTQAGSDSREIFIPALQKWFDVRARYLQWTDGRLAQMLIATDVTERRRAETLAASQAEKAR
jgi:PAS domain S-box-containing protein